MKTTFSRTLVSTAAMMLAALLVIGAVFQALVREYLNETAVQRLENDCDTIASLASAYHFGDRGLGSTQFLINLTVASRVSDADAVICNSTGEVVLCSDSPLGCEHQGLIVSSAYLERVFDEGGAADTGIMQGLYADSRYVVARPVTDPVSGSRIGIVIVSSPTASTVDILQRISNMFLIVSLLVVALAILILTFFVRRQTNPIHEVAKAATAFGHGDLKARVRVDESYPAEVEELAVAFNNMATSLEKSEYQRREFVANVSHELKTPMTTIGGYVDGILDGTIPAEKQREYMQIVSDETKRLSRLVRSMLDISRLQDQGGMPEEKKTVFDLEECTGQVLITFEQKINAKGLDVDVQMPEHPVETRANPDSITQVIYNLLDNAVKFCPQGGRLRLTIREGGSKAYISVGNDGEAIPADELPLVFDRFHKLDKSRSQNRDGWGLGLYIVKTIVCSHGEDISVTSRDGWTEFTFTMPLLN